MKCLFLAAGYATRLYPLTENFPKPLLPVGEKPILDHLIEDIDTLGLVDEYIVISNHKFVQHFEDWAKNSTYPITVIDDGTSSNETRLGAVCDIQFAIDKLSLNDDLLVLAGDNLLDFSLTKFIKYATEKNSSCTMHYYEENPAKLSKSGVVSINENDLVTSMEEKPEVPKSNWCCPPFYYYTKEDAMLVSKGIDAGCGVDAPGSFVAWLCKQTDVYAMEMPGKRYDIGNLESYEKIKKEYSGITQ